MKFDFVVTPSEEAKICLNCGKKRCTPNHCDRFIKMKEKLERKKTTPKQKNLKAGGNIKNERDEQALLPKD